MRPNVLGVTIVNILPSFFHARNFFNIFKLAQENFLKFLWCRSRYYSRHVHIRVSSPGEAKINHPNHFVIFIEQNIPKIQISMHKIIRFCLGEVFRRDSRERTIRFRSRRSDSAPFYAYTPE